MLAAARMGEQGLELYAKNLEFLSEEAKIQHLQRPAAATANRIMLDLRTMAFRDYSAPEARGIPTIVAAPYAGHSAVIADYYKGQSLVETLLANGLDRVLLTDWKSATADMKDLDVRRAFSRQGRQSGACGSADRYGRRERPGQAHGAHLSDCVL